MRSGFAMTLRTHDLLPFERRVLDVCRSAGKGALVPFDELGIGVDDDVDVWWKEFHDEVVQEAPVRGYVSWVFRTLAVIGVGLLALLAALALGYAGAHRPDDAVAQIVAVAAFGSVRRRRLPDQRRRLVRPPVTARESSRT